MITKKESEEVGRLLKVEFWRGGMAGLLTAIAIYVVGYGLPYLVAHW